MTDIEPGDMLVFGPFVNYMVAHYTRKDDAKGNLAESFFFVGLALGHENPKLVEAAELYVKHMRGMTLKEMVDGVALPFREWEAQAAKK
jgi:hypothetical protein